MNKQNTRIYLSTFSEDALSVIKKYDVGVEFNQFCVSKTLDDNVFNGTLAAMERDAIECGAALPGADTDGADPAEELKQVEGRAGARIASDDITTGADTVEAAGCDDTDSEGCCGEQNTASGCDTSVAEPDTTSEGYYGEPEVDEMLAYLGIAGGRPKGNIIDPSKAMVHGPFTEFIPSAIDPAALDFMRQRVNKAAEGAMILGMNRLVLHTGYYPTVYFPEWHVQRSEIFWKEFVQDKPEDFRVYVENVFDPEPDTLKEIVEKVADPRVRACIDIGHASAVGSDPIEWIKAIGENIGHFHLHNNDGTRDGHLPLTDGVIDMEQVLCTIRDYCTEDVTFTIESRDCDSSVAWLKEHLGLL